MSDDPKPLPSATPDETAEDEGEEESEEEGEAENEPATPARPPMPTFKFATFLYVFLGLLGLWMPIAA